MSLETTIILIVNLTLPIFFVNYENKIEVSISGSTTIPQLTIDFGDNCLYRNDLNSSSFQYVPTSDGNHPMLDVFVTHAYRTTGSFAVTATISNGRVSTNSTSVATVIEKIQNVEVTLLSSAIVPLYEKVEAMANVQFGTNLTFDWDFGDESSEDYTIVENFLNNTSTARHSYQVAKIYIISVHVSSPYEEQGVKVILNQTVQAIDLIEEVTVHSLSGWYAAPLLEISDSTFSTKPVVFEARVWHGSDIEFVFDFGDGTEKRVFAVLDEWFRPYGIAEHLYSEEGTYVVSVVAKNPLGAVKSIAEYPFIIQRLPEGLSLGERYHTLPRNASLDLNAAITSGTNVSFDWFLNGSRLNVTGPQLSLVFDECGTYFIIVEAYNMVTDETDESLRPGSSTKVYVQDLLEDVKLCMTSASFKRSCGVGWQQFPLDEEILFSAEILPSTEKTLRLKWNIGQNNQVINHSPVLKHKFQNPGLYSINVTVQNYISSVSSNVTLVHSIKKLTNLTAVHMKGPNLLNHPITFKTLYWFGSDLNFEWNFGDGFVALTNTSSIVHSYTRVGEYKVSVRVWNAFSSDSIETNVFIMYYECMKPDVHFLGQSKDIMMLSSEEILLEINLLTSCKSREVGYQWQLITASGNSIDTTREPDRFFQNQLHLPAFLLLPQKYIVTLKVSMVGTIVYSFTSTSLTVVDPLPTISFYGGFVRWGGRNDIIDMHAVMSLNISSENFQWHCSSLVPRNIACFPSEGPLAFYDNSSSSFAMPLSSFNPQLHIAVINVSSIAVPSTSASQVIEITENASLSIILTCKTCESHLVNGDQKITFEVGCNNCNLEHEIVYSWKVWLIQNGQQEFLFDNSCVHPDGSIHYMMAENFTSSILNSDVTDSISETYNESSIGLQDTNLEKFPYFLPEDTDYSIAEDGFSKGKVRKRQLNHITDRRAFGLTYDDMLVEGDALFDNVSLPDDLLDNDLDNLGLNLYNSVAEGDVDDAHHRPIGPHFPITEEGLPGESGSALARDQSQQRLGIFLEKDKSTLEGSANGRVKTDEIDEDSGNELPGDPVRDTRYDSSIPHLVQQPKVPLLIHRDDTTTGTSGPHFTLKPYVLTRGSSYLIQASVEDVQSGMQGLAMEYVKVRIGPKHGRCTLMPLAGHALQSVFQLHCSEWKSDSQTLFYEVTYSLLPHKESHLIYFGLNPSTKFILPSGHPKSNYSVNVNVVVRDNTGASMKACNIRCHIMPTQTNGTVLDYIYNEIFHEKISFNHLVREKKDHATLQQMQSFITTLNMLPPVYKRHLNADLMMKKEIRWYFLRILRNLSMYSKDKAVQAITVLGDILAVPVEIEPYQLQVGLNCLSNFIKNKHKFGGTYSSEGLQDKIISALSIVATTADRLSQQTSSQVMDLLSMSKNLLSIEIKNVLMTRGCLEDPVLIERKVMSYGAMYVTANRRNYTVDTGNTTVLFPSTLIEFTDVSGIPLLSYTDDCLYPCVAVITEEHSLVADENVLFRLSNTQFIITLYKFVSCANFENMELARLPQNSHLTVMFKKNPAFENNETYTFLSRSMNIHVLNITKENMEHLLECHVKFFPENYPIQSLALIAFVNYGTPPNLHSFKQKLELWHYSDSFRFYITPSHLNKTGLYYITLANLDVIEGNAAMNTTKTAFSYRISISLHTCIQKINMAWIRDGCITEPSYNSNNNVLCKCQSMSGISLLTSSVETSAFSILISSLVEQHAMYLAFGFVTLTIFIYFILLIPTYYNDMNHQMLSDPIIVKGSQWKQPQKYVLTVKTGSFLNAGTTSSVYVVLHGDKKVTDAKTLSHPEKKLCFTRNSTVTFVLSTPEPLGDMIKLDIWHDNTGSSPSWYLSSISIRDCLKNKEYFFPCYNWLSATKFNSCMERELAVSHVRPSISKVFYIYLVDVLYGINIWSAVVFNTVNSKFSGIQRLTCCLCFILCSTAVVSVASPYIFYKDVLLPHVSGGMLFFSFIVSLLLSLIQLIPSILFCHCEVSDWSIITALRGGVSAVLSKSLFCCLQGKYSFRGSSYNESEFSYSISSSHWSSFASGIEIPNPHIETGNFDDASPREPGILPRVHRTILTLEALQSWRRQRNGTISERSYEIPNCSIDEYENIYIRRGLDKHNFASVQPDVSKNDISTDDVMNQVSKDEFLDSLNLNKRRTSFSLYLYFIGWSFLALQSIIAIGLIISYPPKLGIQQSFQWLLTLGLSILFSSFLVYPTMALLVAIGRLFLRIYSNGHVFGSSDSVACISKDASSHVSSRWRYFQNYLRPPAETEILELKKKYLSQKFICSCLNGWMKTLIILIVLHLLAVCFYRTDYYAQKLSIEKTFTRKPFKTQSELWNWMQFDLPNLFHGSRECPQNQDCDIVTLTGSHLLTPMTITKFYHPPVACNNVNQWLGLHPCKPLRDVSFSEKTMDGQHYGEVNDTRAEELLNNHTRALHIKFVLFNPTFSTLLSINLALRFHHGNAITMSPEVLMLTLSRGSSLSFFAFFILWGLFLLITLISAKTLLWKMVKLRKMFPRTPFDIYNLVVTLVAFAFILSSSLHLVRLNLFSHHIRNRSPRDDIPMKSLANLEMWTRNLLGLTIFLHVIGFLRWMEINSHMHSYMHVFRASWKALSTLGVIITFLSLLGGYSGRLISHNYSPHPLIMKSMNLFLQDYAKPEITNSNISVTCLLILLYIMRMGFYFVAISMLKAVLISSRKAYVSKRKGIKPKEAFEVVKSKLKSHFKPYCEKSVVRRDTKLPLELVLEELDSLTDKLISKAEAFLTCGNDDNHSIHPEDDTLEFHTSQDPESKMSSESSIRSSTDVSLSESASTRNSITSHEESDLGIPAGSVIQMLAHRNSRREQAQKNILASTDLCRNIRRRSLPSQISQVPPPNSTIYVTATIETHQI